MRFIWIVSTQKHRTEDGNGFAVVCFANFFSDGLALAGLFADELPAELTQVGETNGARRSVIEKYRAGSTEGVWHDGRIGQFVYTSVHAKI